MHPPPLEQALVVQGLHHAFGARTVLEDVSFGLRRGQIVAVVGPSGCGKSTLLQLCAGLLTPQRGTVHANVGGCAVVFQQARLLPWKTCADNIALGLRAAGVPTVQRAARVRAVAAQVGLDAHALGQFPHALSGGMQSRAALARALVLEPDVLLLDEPFSALDVGLRSQMHELLLRLQGERRWAVLLITHDLAEAVRLADTVLVMATAPGRLAARFHPHGAASGRDEAAVAQAHTELLRMPAVRGAFGLAPLEPVRQGGA